MKHLKKNLDKIKECVVKHDLDWFITIEGYERSGKSKLAKIIAQYFDEEITVKQFVFTLPQLHQLLYTEEPPLKKGQVVIIDEGAVALFKREAMKTENIDGVKLLTTMGYRNLLVVICVPSAFDLIENYVMRHRIKTLIKITRRGKYKVYNRKLIKRIHFNNKTRSWVYPQCAFAERFKAPDDELWEEYLKKKNEYLTERSGKYKEILPNGVRLVGMNEAEDITGVSWQTVKRRVEDGKYTGYRDPINNNLKVDANELISIHGKGNANTIDSLNSLK